MSEDFTNLREYFLSRYPKQLNTLLIKIYIFSYVWGFAGILKREDNAEDDNIINQKSHVKTNTDTLTQEFDEFVRELFESNVKYGIYLPPGDKAVFDYFLDPTTANFIEWSRILPNIENQIRQHQNVPYNEDSIISTVDSIRFSFLSTLILSTRSCVLITGSSGIGKSVTIDHMLKRLAINGFRNQVNSILGEVFNFAEKQKVPITANLNMFGGDSVGGGNNKKTSKMDEVAILTNKIQFSAQTSSNKFLNAFTLKLLKKGQNVLGAPKNKTILTFIDDLNIPIADKFGDQGPMELLRFIQENSTKKFLFKFQNFAEF
jgi:dynein heavy chain